jgi:hypothetical protein
LPDILEFISVYLRIPTKFLLRCFNKYHYSPKEIGKIRSFVCKLESIENKIKHVKSVVERILLRIER